MSEENVNEVSEEIEGAEPVETKAKRDKKLTKAIDGTKITITVIGGEKGEMVFDTADLPEDVQAALVPFGASHKLGDSAAGRSGKEAEEAIETVWQGLLEGNWTTRTPAAPKVKIADVKNALDNMSDEERERAQALLAQMGIKL